VGHVTSFARLNLIGMGKNMFLLTLVLAGIVAASQAQGNSNHLSGQTSLYLKRAVSQPVDWYPWGPGAFQRAKQLNRPILLDVGAVWCPWCILMDRETYTNASAADYINQHFVAVKVDFDSAPELVAQLQRAQAVLTFLQGCLSPLSSLRTESCTLEGDTCRPSARVTNHHSEKQRKKL